MKRTAIKRAIYDAADRIGKAWNSTLAIGTALKRRPFNRRLAKPVKPSFDELLAKARAAIPPATPRKGLRKMSEKRQQLQAARAVCRRIVLQRCGHVCEMKIAGVCTFNAVDVHEKLTRARLGSIIDPDNCLGACRECHDHAHRNPAWATNAGLLISGHVAIEPVNEYAPSQREGRVA